MSIRQRWISAFDRLDRAVTGWMACHGLLVLRLSLALIFIWFGALKLAPEIDPVTRLVQRSAWFADPRWFIPLLAVWEIAIGLGLLTRCCLRLTLLLLFLHLPGTALPLLVLPGEVWTRFPFGLTVEGHYIVKNLVLLGAALVLGATARGGGLVAEQGDGEDGTT